MKKWGPGKILFLLFVLALLAVGMVLAWFSSWRADRQADLDAASEVVDLPVGRMEYAVHGEGPAVLVFHGAPGGYDQALLLGEAAREGGFQVIAPSRPGYLRTPLGTGLLPQQQAAAMAALLDHLGVQRVAVLAFSEGAPAAIEFALRYPERTRALILVSGTIVPFNQSKPGETAEFGRAILQKLTGDIGSWIALEAAESRPQSVLPWLLEVSDRGDARLRETVAQYVLSRPEQRDWLAAFVGTFAPLSPRETGSRNDLLQIRAMRNPDWKKLTVPTLFVHGTLDRCVPVAAVQEAAKVSKAEFFAVQDAGHLVELGPQGPEVRKAVLRFLNQHATAP